MQLQAQTVPITATYKTPETGRLDRVASKAVTFKVGYQYTNTSASNFLKAYIDDGSPQNVPNTSLTTQTDIENKTINTGLPVGAVAGSHSVSLTGSASYSIPISIAVGTQGVMPSLAIGYNSHAGNGLLGMGWNLGGLSAISRSGKDIYHEGVVSAVENSDGTDFYTLDGNRLTLKSGTYGASGSTYSTEEETFSQITLSGSGLSTWFKVETKDGKTLEYGSSDVSRHNAINTVMYWQLHKITDIYGNYVLFKYLNADNQFLLDEIAYTGNDVAGVSPYNSVKFTYATRQDANTVYMAGTILKNKYLLTGIKSLAEGATVSEYAFFYSNNELYSFLTKVEQIGSDGTRLNSTIFKYGDETSFVSTPIGVLDGTSYDIFSGDFDGDGFTDLIRAERVPNTPYHNKLSYFKNEDGGFLGSASATTEINNYSSIIQAPIGGEYSSKYSDYLVSDANGDGKDDIVVLERQLGANSLTSVHYYSVFNNSIILHDDVYDVGYQDNAKYFDAQNANHHFLPGDFDGDGKMDFITILRNASGTFTTKISFPKAANPVVSSTLGVHAVGYHFPPSDWWAMARVQVMDIDGDGKQEVVVANADNSIVEIFTIERTATNTMTVRALFNTDVLENTTYDDLYFGDFNGDRKADILKTNGYDPNIATIFYSTGKDFVAKPFTLLGAGNAPKLQIGDFNGDGASDILNSYTTSNSSPNPNGDPDAPRITTYSTKINIYYFSGDNYQFVQYTDNQRSAANTGLILGDFNGDGRTDGLPRYGTLSAYPRLWLFKPKGQARLLQKVANGYNHITEFQYKLLTEGSPLYNGALDNSVPLRIARFPLQVVSKVITPTASSDNPIFETSYAYENATIHNAGRGFLGFGKVTQSTSGNFKSVTEQEFLPPFYVPMVKTQSSTAGTGNETVAHTTNVNEIVDLGNKRFWRRVTESTSFNALKANKTHTKNTFDTNGNLLTSTGTINDGVETTTLTNSDFCNCGSWLPSKPQKTVTTNLRSGATAVSKTMTTTYDATKGSVLTTSDFSDKSEKGTTPYSNYNAFGQAQSISVQSTTSVASGQAIAQNPITRTSTVEYDTKGRFVVKKTNTLGQSNAQNTTYDPKWGKPVSETTINGLTTLYEYDGFGRAKKVTMPEGYAVTTAYIWEVKTGNGSSTTDADNAFYYTHTQHTGRPDTKTWYDLLGRTRQTATEGWANKTINTVVTYDELGRAKAKTLPFYTGDAPVLTTLAYNQYGTVVSETNGIGTTNYTYDYNPSNLLTISAATTLKTTITNPMGQATSGVTDGSGKAKLTTDNKGIVTEIKYDSWGNPISTTVAGVEVVTMTYDDYGRQTTLADKNAGTTTYLYNSFGELVKQVNPKGTHTMEYDVLGRIKKRTGTEGITLYDYVPSGNGINQVKTITGFSGETKAFTYDTFGRTLTETDVIDGISFVNTYTYDQYSNLLTVKYPSDLLISREYDANGYLKNIKNGSTTIFENTSKNALGQYTAYTLGGNQAVEKTYNQYGVPTNFKANSGVIQNLSFEFELKTGNLTRRTDHRKNKYEYFTYDDINRLTSAQTGNIGAALSGELQTYTFANNGNITSKTGIGAYKYDPVKLHAVVEVENTTAVIPTISQFITYSAFQQPTTITEGTNVLTYTYSSDYQRIKGVLSGNAGAVLNKRYYFGDFERDITSGVTRDIHYIGADGLNCIIEKIGTTVTYYYVYKDYLGSILTVTNSTGTIVEEKNYDAWGKDRNVNDWTYNNVAANNLSWLTRGYTGHEHLQQFGLINMNGRLYDPILGRMLSPDNYTQGGSQGYNRYTYAMNNPLKYTDPSGQIAFLAPIVYLGAAVVGGIGNLWGNWDKVGGSWGAGLAYFVSGAAGGVIGLHNIYAGSVFTSVANIGIDVATGHLPDVQNFQDFMAYAAKDVALAVITTGAASFVGNQLNGLAKSFKEKYSDFVRSSVSNIGTKIIEAAEDVAFGIQATGNFVVSAARRGANYFGMADMFRKGLANKIWDKVAASADDMTLIGGSADEIIKTPNEIALELLMNEQHKLDHIFAAKHNFDSLIDEFGGHENTLRAVLDAADGKLPIDGVFRNIPVNVAGRTILLRGKVIDGITRLSTMMYP